jgi:hypothetical protein
MLILSRVLCPKVVRHIGWVTVGKANTQRKPIWTFFPHFWHSKNYLTIKTSIEEIKTTHVSYSSLKRSQILRSIDKTTFSPCVNHCLKPSKPVAYRFDMYLRMHLSASSHVIFMYTAIIRRISSHGIFELFKASQPTTITSSMKQRHRSVKHDSTCT